MKWRPPFIVQPKLDGDRCRVLIEANNVRMLSSEENEITHVPHLLDFFNQVFHPTIELDGELYCHGMQHEEIHGIASRRVNYHSNMEALEYHIFDVITNQPQHKRLTALRDINLLLKVYPQRPVHVVPFEVAENLDDVLRIYDKFVSQGYEGIIVRDHAAGYVRKRSTQVMKFKPKKEDYYVIVGSVEEVSISGEKKNSLGALICRANEGEELFNVGTGFTQEVRRTLWQKRTSLVGKVVRVAYQHITSGRGVPRFPVFCEIIWDLSSVPNEE